MTFDAFRKNIRTWIADTLSIEVIFSHGKGPRPNGQYAVLNVVSIEKLIEDVRTEARKSDGKVKANYQGIRKVMISINIYRANTMEQMMKLRGSLEKISTQDYFNTLDVGLINSSNVNHIPEQIGKDWEDRSQCDFFFHYIPTVESDADISEIKQIEVTNKINNETLKIIVTINFGFYSGINIVGFGDINDSSIGGGFASLI